MVRFKNRFILAEATVQSANKGKPPSERDIIFALRDSVQANYGDFGAGTTMSSMQLKFYDPVTGLVVIRCSRDTLDTVSNSLLFLGTVKKHTTAFRIVNVSGSSRCCEKVMASMYATRRAAMGLEDDHSTLINPLPSFD